MELYFRINYRNRLQIALAYLRHIGQKWINITSSLVKIVQNLNHFLLDIPLTKTIC